MMKNLLRRRISGAFLAIASIVVVALAVDDARAVTLRVGDAFAAELRPNAHLCVLYPTSPLDPALCAGIKPIAYAPDPDSVGHVVTIGIVRFLDEDKGDPVFAVLTFTTATMPNAALPTTSTVQAFGGGVVKGFLGSVPGASIRGGQPSTQLVDAGGALVARVSFDVDGLGDGHQNLEHVVSYTAWAREGSYSLLFTCKSAFAHAVDALAAETAVSMRVAHAPSSVRERLGYFIGVVMGMGVVVGGAILAAIVIARRQKGRGQRAPGSERLA
jgi:hypothetical protein